MAILVVLVLSGIVPDDGAVVTRVDESQGVLIHEVESSFQVGKTQIRLLLPDALQPEQKYPAIYVLPVEAQHETRYGDGLVEVKRHNMHNKHQVIFIAPTFSILPWYADHPTESTVQQETYFLKVVVPFVEKSYPVLPGPEGRLLLGFSKSGWGAWSLLLRHPDVFGRAAAWDAPLMMDRLGRYGTSPIFGNQENFRQYQITSLLRATAESLGLTKRLVLTGYGNFRQDHQQVHSLMDELKIPHEYRDGPQRKHDWHSGWVSEAVELLVDRPSDK